MAPLTTPFILIATPVYGKVTYEQHTQSILKLFSDAAQRGIRMSRMTVSDSLITRSRDNLTSLFLQEQQFTHLLWIDADIAFEPDQVWRLLEHDEGVCVAAYPFKGIQWPDPATLPKGISPYGLQMATHRYVLNSVAGAVPTQDEFIEVLDGATGFMLIKREVLQAMVEAYPELSYWSDQPGWDNPYQYLFYEEMIEELPDGKRRRLSEDYAFCRKWQKIGGTIWLDLNSKLTHIGPHEFVGDLKATMQVRTFINEYNTLVTVD